MGLAVGLSHSHGEPPYHLPLLSGVAFIWAINSLCRLAVLAERVGFEPTVPNRSLHAMPVCPGRQASVPLCRHGGKESAAGRSRTGFPALPCLMAAHPSLSGCRGLRTAVALWAVLVLGVSHPSLRPTPAFQAVVGFASAERLRRCPQRSVLRTLLCGSSVELPPHVGYNGAGRKGIL